MATTVEATTREQTDRAGDSHALVPGPDQRCSRGRPSRCSCWRSLGGVVLVSSGKRKEEFAARSLNQARAAAEAGNLPLASSELQRLIDDVQGHRRGHRGGHHPEPGPDGQRPERARRGRAPGVPGQQARRPVPGAGLRAAGRRAGESKRWAEAAEAYTNASKRRRSGVPEGAIPDRRGAGVPRRRARPTEAVAAYRTVIEKHPEEPELHRGEGPAGGADGREDVDVGRTSGGQTVGAGAPVAPSFVDPRVNDV